MDPPLLIDLDTGTRLIAKFGEKLVNVTILKWRHGRESVKLNFNGENDRTWSSWHQPSRMTVVRLLNPDGSEITPEVKEVTSVAHTPDVFYHMNEIKWYAAARGWKVDISFYPEDE